MEKPFYEIFIDTGGTFTDLIAYDDEQQIYKIKILSKGSLRGKLLSQINKRTFLIEENWGLKKDILKGFHFSLLHEPETIFNVESFDVQKKYLTLNRDVFLNGDVKEFVFEIKTGEEVPVLAARIITQTGLEDNFPPMHMRLGTTRGTNALLESKGAKSALFITKGFADLLKIGTQQRPNIFSLQIPEPVVLPEKIIEVDERIASDGTILKPVSVGDYLREVVRLKNEGFTSVSVAFLHSWKNPKHENLFREFLVKNGFQYISVSSVLTPLIKVLERTQTATVNAYLNPVISHYLKGIMAVTGNDLLVMNSAGGLVKASEFNPKDSLLSGPAGGVVGAALVGRQCNRQNLITFDMGGTSTDVSRYSGGYDYRYEIAFGKAKLFSPAIAIETVAAGGGSICSFDGFKMVVGPESAGAYPGPACYGAGGPLTITDINLLSGRLDTEFFGIPVSRVAALERLEELLLEMENQTGHKPQKEAVLTGFLSIANELMAGAIRKISVANGFDPSEYTLLAFGGAGGMHACAIAGDLGMSQIIIPADAGILSAVGIGEAVEEKIAEKMILLDFNKTVSTLDKSFNDLAEDLLASTSQQEFHVARRTLYLRFGGQDATLPVEWTGRATEALNDFRKEYEKLYGHWIENRPVEVESIRVAIKRNNRIKNSSPPVKQSKTKAQPHHFVEGFLEGQKVQMPVFLKDTLSPGCSFQGPALITDDKSTTFVEKHWKVTVDNLENLILAKVNNEKKKDDKTHETKLELFTNRFRLLAENMGGVLQRTALSVNIKERLDFSCALLDANGYLVANAPHIPVHLGGLGICVREVLKNFSLSEGDTIVTNHPKFGGSHLPDVTLITPVFNNEGQRIAFVVNRAHHAEIGGISPGSMPPAATRLSEEGVVISPGWLMKRGVARWDEIKEMLTSGKYPTRAVAENLADLKAALAANLSGKEAFLKMVADFGEEEVMYYMDALRDMASRKMRSVLAKFPDGVYSAEEYLDDGSPLKVRVTIKQDTIHFDFTGSAAVHPSNMNATLDIVNSVVIYVMRLLLDEEIPLNDGLMDPVTVFVPEGMLNPLFSDDADECPAVVGGNVEISQRLTDTLLKAFEIVGCSQGTMNNVLFGNQNFGYYETVAGGTGAGEGFHGVSGLHQHMTNTRITDPEIMEHRYPVRIHRFQIRKNSGGRGAFNGGNGLVREYEFLEEVEVSLLTQHRVVAPYGMKGAEPGIRGEQWVVHPDGKKQKLEGITNFKVHKHDRLILKTPGGGGFGI